MTKPKLSTKVRRNNIAKCNQRHYKTSEASLTRARRGVKTKLKSVFELIKKRETSDIYRQVPLKHEFMTIIRHIVEHTKPLAQCCHFMVGSASIIELLRSDLGPMETHRIYITGEQRKIGGIAEEVVFKFFETTHKECRSLHKLPFICATPDLVLEDRIIEVKNAPGLTCSILMQVLISMEVFSKDLAEIIFFDTRNNMIHSKQPDYRCKLTGIIGIRKVGSILTKKFIEHACMGYIHYLLLCFNVMGKFVDEEVLTMAKDELLVNYTRGLPGNWLVSDIKATRFCRNYMSTVYSRIKRFNEHSVPLWKNARDVFKNSVKGQNYRITESMKRINSDFYKDYVFHPQVYSPYVKDRRAPKMTSQDFKKILSGTFYAEAEVENKASADPVEKKARTLPAYRNEPATNIFRGQYAFDDKSFDALMESCVFTDQSDWTDFPYKTWELVNQQRSIPPLLPRIINDCLFPGLWRIHV